MLYLKASSDIEILDNYNGESGVFIKTFALNDKRNKNGWRVTWESIKRNISDFSKNKRPGIEYTKCENSVCDLDHTDGSTYQQSLTVQEPFRKTSIIDYILDENNHTAYVIHKTTDDEFVAKVRSGEIKYVSPSIWPEPGAYDILGKQENGLYILDVYDWKALHIAFVNNPAFGDDAQITALCEGENCQLKLLTAKELGANDLSHLQQIPLLIRHKGSLVFVSATKQMSEQIQEMLYEKEKIIPELLPEIYENNSFSACACSSLQMSPEEQKELTTKLDASVKAMKDKDEKIKDLQSQIEKLKKGSDDDESTETSAKKACTKCDGNHNTEDHDSAGKAKKATVDPRVTALEAKVAEPMISEMLTAREKSGASQDELDTFEKSLKAKSLDDITEIYNNEKIFLTSVSAKQETGVHFDFNGDSGKGALSAKSLEEIFQEND